MLKITAIKLQINRISKNILNSRSVTYALK